MPPRVPENPRTPKPQNPMCLQRNRENGYVDKSADCLGLYASKITCLKRASNLLNLFKMLRVGLSPSARRSLVEERLLEVLVSLGAQALD